MSNRVKPKIWSIIFKGDRTWKFFIDNGGGVSTRPLRVLKEFVHIDPSELTLMIDSDDVFVCHGEEILFLLMNLKTKIPVKETSYLNAEGVRCFTVDDKKTENNLSIKKTPSLFMKLSESRYQLNVNKIELKRIHEKSAEECILEGTSVEEYPEDTIHAYSIWWDENHKSHAEYVTNPYVVCIHFKLEKVSVNAVD